MREGTAYPIRGPLRRRRFAAHEARWRSDAEAAFIWVMSGSVGFLTPTASSLPFRDLDAAAAAAPTAHRFLRDFSDTGASPDAARAR
jgi:hypothetical protein